MNKKLIILSLVLICLTGSVFSQYHEQQDIEVIEDVEYQQQQYGQQQQDQVQRRQQQFSMKRTACLVLSRYHSNTHKDMIQSVIAELQPSDQSKYINKLYAMAIQHCLPTISLDQAQQFFVENAQFNPASMFSIYDGFDYSEPAQNIDSLTPEQKSIIKFIKQFDEQMAVKKQQRQAQEQDAGIDTDNDISIMGMSLKGWGAKSQIAYLSVFLIIVGVALWWGFGNLNNSSNPKKIKKKSKKQ